MMGDAHFGGKLRVWEGHVANRQDMGDTDPANSGRRKQESTV